MNIRVLVANPDGQSRHVKARALAKAGYGIEEAATATAALDLLQRQPIALAILDVDLPDMHGAELCRMVKAAHRSVMVLQTLPPIPAAHVVAADPGPVADAYLVEPIQDTELVMTARALLRVRSAEAALQESEQRFAHFVQEAETQREALVRELNHRVNNTLAIVQALAAQSRLMARSPQEFDRAFTGRLHALARAHDLLTRSNWHDALLSELVAEAVAPFAGSDDIAPRITYGGPAVLIEPNTAVTLSLAFHELAANATEFGALANSTGRMAVAWSIDSLASPAAVSLLWEETGGPAVTQPARKGFGSFLIERALASVSDGTTTLSFPASGVEFRIRLPLSIKVRLA